MTNSDNATEASQARGADAELQPQVADEALLDFLRTREATDTAQDTPPIKDVGFPGMNLEGCKFSHLTLDDVVFDDGLMIDLQFDGAWLNASFERAHLQGASFRDTEIDWADFTDADLTGADFRGASIDQADVTRANLAGVVFDAGTSGVNFLDAANVAGMDISQVDDLEPENRVRLHQRGAIAHTGVRCPRCVRFNLDAQCPFCEGEGWIDEDPEDVKERVALECPWCSGRGHVSYYMGGAESRCLACEETGMVGAWVIDRRRHESELPADFDEFKVEYDELGWFTVADADLSKLPFKHALIKDTDFQNCSLAKSDFSGARFKNVTFRTCDLTDVNLANVRMEQVRFIDCTLARAIWSGGSTRSTSVIDSDLTGAAVSPQRLRKVLLDEVTS